MILEDGWTAITKDKKRSAQLHNLVTDDGAEILT